MIVFDDSFDDSLHQLWMLRLHPGTSIQRLEAEKYPIWKYPLELLAVADTSVYSIGDYKKDL